MKRLGISVAGVLLLSSVGAHAAGAKCEEEAKLKSVDSGLATSITFVNKMRERVRVYWINFDGQRQFYQELNPNGRYQQKTFVTHPWVITDSAENCLGVYIPQTRPTTYTIDEPRAR